MTKEIRGILKDNADDIDELLGKTRLIVAERRNSNIASAVFAKSAFSKNDAVLKDTQKCGKKNCKSCKIMNLCGTITLWKENKSYSKELKLDFKCDCSTESVIYIYVCNICRGNKSFYIGQTVNSCQKRANGHRSSFNEENFNQSSCRNDATPRQCAVVKFEMLFKK